MREPNLGPVFEKVYPRASRLIPCDRFYAVLYHPIHKELSFPFVQEGQERKEWKRRSLKNTQLPDEILVTPQEVLYPSETGENLKISSHNKKILSWIGVPMRQENRVIGALVAERWKSDGVQLFDENHRRVLTMIAQQTAPVIENIRLQTRLEWKVDALRVLNRIGQQLSQGLKKSENEILSLVYESARDLGIDTRSMYIAFYEENLEQPDIFVEGILEKSEIHGRLRFPLVYEEGKQVSYSDRDAQNGLTEYVIRTRKSFNPNDVKKAYREIAQDFIGKIPRSWLGVPILREGKVFGVIVLRNYDYAGLYTPDDVEILEILAGQAAVALHNLRLYQAWEKEQEKRLEAERASVFGMVAAEFAHRMNNIAGTIPVRVDMARAYLKEENPRDKKIAKQLDKIAAETKNLLDAAQAIKQSTETRAPEVVRLKEIAETAQEIARQMYKGENTDIEIGLDIPDDLAFSIDRNALLETLTDMIKNGMDALEHKQSGKIEVRAEKKQQKIYIEIEDNGKGIPLSEQAKIFDLFYTTKGKEGLGFGLWRARTFIKSLGGNIEVESREDEGTILTIFTITLPVSLITDAEEKGAK